MTSIRITVTVPEIVLNSSFVREEIKRKMRAKTSPDLRKEFKKTVEGWENAPDFSATVYESSGSIITHVFPSGNGTKQYSLVNFGSPPHPIPARRGMLRFQAGYRAATRPRVIGSRAKGRFGDFVSTPLIRKHPGFEAREFDETIAIAYEDTFVQDMQDAINVAAVKR